MKELKGQMLVELVMAIGIAAIILPALLTGLVASRQGRPQQQQNIQATELFKETANAVREIRDTDWNAFAVNGVYHPIIVNNAWTLATGSATVNGLNQQIVIADVYRNSSGNIVTSGGTLDPSTKQVVISISWSQPQLTSLGATEYLTRTTNLTHSETTTTDFNKGTLTNAQVTNASGGEIALGNDNNAKWCSPAFSSATINLPDGPPVAVAATASATTTTIPNDVFVALSPTDTTSTKLAYLTVTANALPPVPTLVGTFTLDSTKYSNASLVPTGLGFSNSFTTTDVKYYTSPSGNLYALLGTDMPNKEVIAIQIKSGGNYSWQDPTNHIFKYWTFFNTRQYQGDTRSTPNQDQSPFGYGAESLTVLGNRGYVASGGYLYTFDLSSIDSKSASNGLDEVGCRIELDGYDCQPNNGTDMKYAAGSTNQTGTNWGDTTSPAHLDCTDGGNVEIYADHQMSGVTVGSSNYIYIAVGAGTNPEFDIVNVTNVPTSGTTPSISNNSCGAISGGNSGWKRGGSLDFDTKSNTEEAANSVYAKTDGTRAYMSSNGGVDANHDGLPDSDQFYVIDTTTKTAPKFLSTSSSTQGSVATSGYYNGTGVNLQLYPRRALTVQNGSRAIIVGKDGVSDSNNAYEYQVIDLSTEASPTYCGGLDFDSGFNDLTSVSEADGDNFVYMVANTPDKQLKIIQGGPDNAIYDASGTFESQTFDTASVDGSSLNRAFNRFVADISQPVNTSVQLQTAVAPAINNNCSGVSFYYVGPDGTPNTKFTPSGSTIAGLIPLVDYLPTNNYQNPGRCFRYKAFLSTLDQTLTPSLYDITWNYSQ